MSEAPKPPVIIIGMHRSGTTMIAELLEQMGLFVGWKKDNNCEALFFLKLNEWLMIQGGGSWDNPEPVKTLLQIKEFRELAVNFFKESITKPRIINYLGVKKYLKYKSLKNICLPWGWKDPRNTFTLPLWLELFPEARVINVCRHGVDVAESLRVRVRKSLKTQEINPKWDDIFRKKLVRRADYSLSPRCHDLEGGFSLWEAYMEEAEKQIAGVRDRGFNLKYESFLSGPVEHLCLLADFCGLEYDESKIEKMITRVETGRAFAYKSNAELSNYAKKVNDRLAKFNF